jgi:Plasmid pRiA4b ORF-3-like protein
MCWRAATIRISTTSIAPRMNMPGSGCETGDMCPAISKSASDTFSEIATVRLELRHTDPLIWREFEVPTSITLSVLHDILPAVMGWFDYHLYEFTIGKQKYGLAMDELLGEQPAFDGEQSAPARCTEAGKDCYRLHVRLRRLLGSIGLPLPMSAPVSQGVFYPRYIGGERNGPPEDCGGIPGFCGLLETISDPHTRAMRRLKNGRMITIRIQSMSCPSSTPSAAWPIGVMRRKRVSPRANDRSFLSFVSRLKPHPVGTIDVWACFLAALANTECGVY